MVAAICSTKIRTIKKATLQPILVLGERPRSLGMRVTKKWDPQGHIHHKFKELTRPKAP